MDIPLSADPARPVAPGAEANLRRVAQQLEAGFLAQMLEVAGVGEVPDAFGGGAGETHFASFLRDAQAREMAQSGGVGIAEAVYQSLVERIHE